MDDRLLTLAQRYGVATEFWDWRGVHTQPSEEALCAVLAALGVDASDPGAALAEAETAPWRRTLPATVVSRVGWTPWVPVHLPHGATARVSVELEEGGVRDVPQVDRWVEPREVDGVLVGEATFALPGDLPAGWHRLHAEVDGVQQQSATLIVTPQRLSLPPGLAHGPMWGVMTQLYQVRSAGSWGVGDLTDLASLARWAAGLGAGFVLVNPLHAAQPVAPMEPSPYLPTTRRFANPIYLRVQDTPEYAALDEATRARVDARAAEAARLNGADRLDRDASWALKREALTILFAASGDSDDFTDWAARQGEGLTRFATWCAAQEYYGEQPWPDDLDAADAVAVEEFRVAHAARVRFHCWLQWLLDRQVEAAQGAALAAGMGLGLVHDLAVGVHPEGADAWALRDVLAQGVKVGAPPDQFNQLGQDWSQPPWHPQRLAEMGYEPFRDLVRSLLKDAGGLRIDHIIGLFRLWWIPDGMPATAGAYVHYDHEALVGILVLEAERAGAVLIGEDLGVVEPAAREHLHERGVLGTSVLWFEYDGDQPLPPERYRELCLASVTTHDLPPTAGYLALAHVDLRERLGLLTRPVEEERAAEQAAVDTVRSALAARGLVEDGADVEEQVLGLHRWLARTPSLMRGVALPDLVGDARIINQPGTSDEYPNWRLPLADASGRPVTLEQVVASERARRLAAVVSGSG